MQRIKWTMTIGSL